MNNRTYAIFSLLGFVFLVLILCKVREKDASDQRLAKEKYKSNGEQIYFTAKSQRGNPELPPKICTIHSARVCTG